MSREFRIGGGAAFSTNRMDPAIGLALRSALEVRAFQWVGARTPACGHRDRQAERGTTPTCRCRQEGGRHHRSAVPRSRAYPGTEGVLSAPATGAEVVVTGRRADPSRFVAPPRRPFGRDATASILLGPVTAAEHLRECGAQVAGGHLADLGSEEPARPPALGFPCAEIRADGRIRVTMLTAIGGIVTEQTVKEPLRYEVHDPAHVLTPDIGAGCSRICVTAAGPDRVAARDLSGHARTARPKATFAFGGGRAAADIPNAGEGARARSRPRKRSSGTAWASSTPADLRCARAGSERPPGTRPPVAPPPTSGRPASVRASLRFARRCRPPTMESGVASRFRSRRRRRVPGPGPTDGAPVPGGGGPGADSLPCRTSAGRTRTARLREIARAGAVGQSRRSGLSNCASDRRPDRALCEQRTGDPIRSAFGPPVQGAVARYERSTLAGLPFVCDDALEDGVHASPNLGGHGTARISLLPGLEIELP